MLDLKKAIRRSFTLKQQRQRIKTKISWKYVWRAFHLQNIENGKVMRDNNKNVSEYGEFLSILCLVFLIGFVFFSGVVNKSEIRFVKKLRTKPSPSEIC